MLTETQLLTLMAELESFRVDEFGDTYFGVKIPVRP